MSLMQTIPQSISVTVTATILQKSTTGILIWGLQLLTEPSFTHTDPAHTLEQDLPLQTWCPVFVPPKDIICMILPHQAPGHSALPIHSMFMTLFNVWTRFIDSFVIKWQLFAQFSSTEKLQEHKDTSYSTELDIV